MKTCDNLGVGEPKILVNYWLNDGHTDLRLGHEPGPQPQPGQSRGRVGRIATSQIMMEAPIGWGPPIDGNHSLIYMYIPYVHCIYSNMYNCAAHIVDT